MGTLKHSSTWDILDILWIYHDLPQSTWKVYKSTFHIFSPTCQTPAAIRQSWSMTPGSFKIIRSVFLLRFDVVGLANEHGQMDR